MSEPDLQHLTELLLKELRPYTRFLAWICAGLGTVLVSIVGGTVAVVMFVNEVRNGVRECGTMNAAQEARLVALDGEGRAVKEMVIRHEVILSNRAR